MSNKSKERGESKSRKLRPPQSQSRQPGHQEKMRPQPRTIRDEYRGSGKLEGKVALITGGDSGIGRSVAVMLAANIAIIYVLGLKRFILHDRAGPPSQRRRNN